MNTIDQGFFLKNIPEAFQMRKDWNMEKQNKTVEIDQFFVGLIQGSRMLVQGKSPSRGSSFIL